MRAVVPVVSALRAPACGCVLGPPVWRRSCCLLLTVQRSSSYGPDAPRVPHARLCPGYVAHPAVRCSVQGGGPGARRGYSARLRVLSSMSSLSPTRLRMLPVPRRCCCRCIASRPLLSPSPHGRACRSRSPRSRSPPCPALHVVVSSRCLTHITLFTLFMTGSPRCAFLSVSVASKYGMLREVHQAPD